MYSRRMRLLAGFTCIVMALGCSDDDKVRRLPDAPPPPDADVDASTFGPVSLTILQGTTPQVGVKVVFQNANNSLVTETTTGTDGKASAMMAPGGFVTAFDPFPVPQGISGSELRTYSGVKPGDELRLYQPDFGTPSIDVTFLVPVAPNAGSYRISTNCHVGYEIFTGGSGGTPSATIQLSGCGATTNLLVEAISNGQSVGAIYKPSVALANNGTVDLTQDTYAATPAATFSYTNVPASAESVQVDIQRATSLGAIYYQGGSAAVAGSTAALTTNVPTIANASSITTSSFIGNSTYHSITDWGAPATSYSLDVGAAMLPDFASPPNLDVPNHRITWSNNGGGVQPDFVSVTARLVREAPLQRWNWEIAAAGTNEVVFPVLPAAQSQFNPIDGDDGNISARTGKFPGGYDAIRASILSDGGFELLPLSASGRAQASSYQSLQKGLAPPSASRTGVLRGLRRR